MRKPTNNTSSSSLGLLLISSAVIGAGILVWLIVLTARMPQASANAPNFSLIETCSVNPVSEHTKVSMFNVTEMPDPVMIDTLPGLLLDTIEIITSACNGVVHGINRTTGQISYTPMGITFGGQTVLDIFQYRGLDNCSVWHVVSQTVCSQTVGTPPMVQSNCFPPINGVPPLDTAQRIFGPLNVVAGTNPIDWTSLVFTSFEVYYQCSDQRGTIELNCVNTNDASRAMIPWQNSQCSSMIDGPQIVAFTPPASNLPASTAFLPALLPAIPTSTSVAFSHTLTHNNAGTITYTQTSSNNFPYQAALRFRFQVSDTIGLVSNEGVGYFFYEYVLSGGPNKK